MGKDKFHVNVVGQCVLIYGPIYGLTIYSHRPRRFWQVHHHWTPYLQVRWYR